ncbi:hypothetical protein N7540_013128 [Penicillium herquei]|nr:hypothetical protein N7540_013128 [Penicillium herquei]
MTVKQDTDASASTMLADPSLLEKIDKLFACNVGEHINLPQLVVVGDQSSGKSSVLEGLTKLKFPRNIGLCTRFATQIRFRRDPTSKSRKVSGSIISKGSDEGKENASWTISNVEALNETEFETMMAEGAEDKIIELVEGKQECQGLGWVVVRNLGQDLQNSSKSRDLEEESFRKSPPWNQLSSDNYGIESLRARLQILLTSNVRREFPSVRSEVSKQLKRCKKMLENLGEERVTADQQRKFLLEIVTKFQPPSKHTSEAIVWKTKRSRNFPSLSEILGTSRD